MRRNVWLVLEPPQLDGEGTHGVYPRTDRNSLFMKIGPNVDGPLPFADWGAAFCDAMPEPILDALRNARSTGSGTIRDQTWRERLAERFGALWKIERLQARSLGSLRVALVQAGLVPRPAQANEGEGGTPGSDHGGRGGSLAIGNAVGPTPAKKTRVAGGIPTYLPVRAKDMDEPYLLAVWQPHHPEHPEGAVLLNIEHPMLEAVIARWQAMYPDHLSDAIRDEVIGVYGETAVAKVAHSEQMRVIMPRLVIEQELRSSSSLTMALLGLMGKRLCSRRGSEESSGESVSSQQPKDKAYRNGRPGVAGRPARPPMVGRARRSLAVSPRSPA